MQKRAYIHLPFYLAPCAEEYDDVADTFHQFQSDASAFLALDDVDGVIQQNIEDNMALIEAWGSQMDPAWDHGLYFNAGQFYGLMAELVFDTPDEPWT